MPGKRAFPFIRKPTGLWGTLGLQRTAPWLVVLLVMLGMGITWVHLTKVNHDVAVSLSTAQRCLEGERLYSDITDINPPLYIWMATPPVALAKAWNLPAVAVYNAFTIAEVLGGLALCWLVMARTCLLPNKVMRRVFLLTAAYGFFAMVPDSRFRGFHDFGQRDFLMTVLFLPYLLLSTARAMHRRVAWPLSLLLGLIGGVGLAFKPYFLLPFVVIEGYLTFGRKAGFFWRRPEVLAVAGLQALFAALWITPDYLHMLRLAANVYAAYDTSLEDMFSISLVVAPTAYAALVAMAVTRPTPETRQLRRILAIALVCWLITLFVQHKGFSYHHYAARVAGLLLLVVIALGAARRAQVEGRLFRPGLVAASIVMLLLAGQFLVVRKAWQLAENPSWTIAGVMQPPIEQLAKDKSMMFLSSSVYPAFPLYNYTGARWESHFNCLWLLPGFYHDARPGPDGTVYHARADMSEDEKWQLDTLVGDFERTRPALVIVDASRSKQGFGTTDFDFLKYLLRDARFQTFWNQGGYKIVGTVGGAYGFGPYAFWMRFNP